MGGGELMKLYSTASNYVQIENNAQTIIRGSVASDSILKAENPDFSGTGISGTGQSVGVQGLGVYGIYGISTTSGGAAGYFQGTDGARGLDVDGGLYVDGVQIVGPQTLSVSGSTLSISNGNSVSLPTDGDSNPSNEIQSLSISGNTLSISSGNSITLPADGDSNPSNEIQSLSVSGNTLSISGGNSVSLPGATDVWVNTAGDQMTGDLGFAGEVGVGSTDNDWWRIYMTGHYGADNGVLHIGTGDNGNEPIQLEQNGNPKLTISGNNGYVGVGTTNPSQRLDVSGNMRVTGSLYANQICIGGSCLLPCGDHYYDPNEGVCYGSKIYLPGDWVLYRYFRHDQSNPDGQWSNLQIFSGTFPFKVDRIKADAVFDNQGFLAFFQGNARTGLWHRAFSTNTYNSCYYVKSRAGGCQQPPCEKIPVGEDYKYRGNTPPYYEGGEYWDDSKLNWCGYAINGDWGGALNNNEEFAITGGKGSGFKIYSSHRIGSAEDYHSYNLYFRVAPIN
jgi:hypothetical protein